MLLKYYADSESQLAAIEYWTMGSLASVTAGKVLSVLPFWLIGFAGLLLLRRQVELMSLNEEECRALGVRLRPVRLTILALSTLLVASVICVTGLISFAGLKMLKSIKRNAFNTVILLSVIAAMLACTVFAVSFSSVYYILICGTAGLAIFFLKKLRKGNGNKQ